MLAAALTICQLSAEQPRIRPQLLECDIVLTNSGSLITKSGIIEKDAYRNPAQVQLAFETKGLNNRVLALDLSQEASKQLISASEFRFGTRDGLRVLRGGHNLILTSQAGHPSRTAADLFLADLEKTVPYPGVENLSYPLAISHIAQIDKFTTAENSRFKDVLMLISNVTEAETKRILEAKLPDFKGLIVYPPQDSAPKVYNPKSLFFPKTEDATTYRLSYDAKGWRARETDHYIGVNH